MEELIKYILNAALRAGICKEWALKIALANTKDDLLAMYVSGIDFCIKTDFPSNAYLINIGGALIRDYGIYIDNLKWDEVSDFMVLLGTTAANLKYENYDVAQLYIKHHSSAKISASGHAFLMVDIFDNANLQVIATGQCNIVINVYGNAIVTSDSTANSVIKVKHKNKKTY